jgi:hypothetical protein
MGLPEAKTTCRGRKSNSLTPAQVVHSLKQLSHPERLRIYQPAPELDRKLELFCELRRKVVGLAVKLENHCDTLTRLLKMTN